ncbi:hypothetical protein ACT29H_03270 [Thermophagus sp. OGC60D27]|uniref:hypothetical protein n=1 Tax=Thermophagus sp. OGC60D27 TaxID=3458415 RepID=UPI004037A176
MFQGIADQIKEAQREIFKQEALQNYYEMLTKYRKEQIRNEKKTNTAFSKLVLSHLSSRNLDQIPGLRSFFYVVFEKQENEKDLKRRRFIVTYLLLNSFSDSIQVFSDELEKITPVMKSKRETRSLRVLVKNIKQSTLDKYYYQEVSSMLHLVGKAGEVKARKVILDQALEMGKEIQLKLADAVKNLKNEKSWGSWEMFFSRKIKYDAIPPSEIDQVYGMIPSLASQIKCFAVIVEPFFPSRDILILNKLADHFVPGLISDLMQDWLVESKTKKMRSRINQILGNIDLMVRTLMVLKDQNKSEMELMDIERQNRIEYTEEYVRKKLSEKI